MHAIDHDGEQDLVRRLLHRSFVQYNPLYLMSAALILAGLWLLSREAAHHASLAGQLGVAGIAEVYSIALIGGAAILTRARMRRPAVMLGLLSVLYQCDLTLHVETCAYLGDLGRVASAVWVVLFVLKLLALAWALELRPSRSALVVPTLGALGLALLPHVFRYVDPDARTSLVAIFVFGVGAAGAWTSRRVESAVGFDVRGVRALRGAWIAWAVLAFGHVLYWAAEQDVRLIALGPVASLLATRALRRERGVWALSIATLAAVGLLLPASFSITALMVAVVLALRARYTPLEPAGEPAKTPALPYRAASFVEAPAPPALVLAPADPHAAERLILGALVALYASLWTRAWPGGAWPAHELALDALLALGCAVLVWKTRRFVAAVPVAATIADRAIRLGWIAAPRSALEWGVSAIVLGFALLGVALALTWWLRPRDADQPCDASRAHAGSAPPPLS